MLPAVPTADAREHMRAAAWVLAWAVVAASPAHADDSCLVRARILDHDGKPLPKVRVLPIVPGMRSTIPDREGRFELKMPCGVARVLDIEAVQHRELMIPALSTSRRTFEFEARLAPLEWNDRFDSVRVIGDFNGYATGSGVPMTQRPDGTFAATIPCRAESLRYQLLGVAKDGLPTAGTMADTFFLRSARGIASIRAGGKPVEVVFDPRRLPRAKGDAVVRFADPNDPSARLLPLFRENTEEEERSGRAYQAFVAAGGDRDSFRWDASGYRSSLAGRIPAEHDPLRRQYLLLTFFRTGGSKSDSLLALSALDEIPPESPLWGLAPGGPGTAMWSLWRNTGRLSRIQAYAERGSEANPDRDVRAGFLSVAMDAAKEAGDKDRLGRYTTRMMSEFQGTFYEEISRKTLAPNRKIRPGQPAPDVAFTGLEDSSQVIRISDFRGRHLLIDFWAVWCGPCRMEMPNLQRAWETFENRGLAVLSVSFDLQRADVAAYRRDKWSMPWRHAFADGGFDSKESAAFDVWGIPKPVLIGPDGVIEAEGDELRGEKLGQVLARVLGEPASGTQHR